MPSRTAWVAAVLGGALLAVKAAPPAGADSTSAAGAITTTISGVPAKVSVGGSFSLTFTIRSASVYRIEVEDFSFSLDNLASEDDATGVDVRWDDPATGLWRLSSAEPGEGVWALSEPARTVWIAPHGSLSVRLFITLNGAAQRGTDVLATTGINAYSLFNEAGVNVPGVLSYNHATAKFFFGAPSNGTDSESAPADQPADQSTSAVPLGGATGAPSVAPAQAMPVPPGSAESFATTDGVPLAGSPAPAANSQGSGFTTYAAALVALVLLGFGTFAGGILLTRRIRGCR